MALSQKTLVFPNQTAADSWALYCAQNCPDTAFFNDRFLSWDRFRDSCKALPSDRDEAGAIHRLLFVSLFLEKNRLPALCPENYPEAKTLFANEIAARLQDFPSALENNRNLDYALEKDIRSVLDAYRQFLDENSLYEKSFIKPDFSGADKNTVLVFPGAVADSGIKSAIESGHFEVFNADGHFEAGVFPDSLKEIRSVLDRIRSLMLAGEPARNIKITAADVKMFPWLETEAARRGIKINIVKGKMLSEYACGRFFSAIRAVIDKKWSLDSVRDLVLEPSFPYRDRRAMCSLFRRGVEYRVVPSFAAKSWISKLEGNTFAKKLRDRVQSFSSALSVAALREAIHAFEDDFLENNPWSGEGMEIESGAWSRCMRILEDMEDITEALHPANTGSRALKASGGPFALFLRLLGMTAYTPVATENAVSVYLYPSNAGMAAPYHFALGFDDSATRCRIAVAPYSDDEGIEIGSFVIGAYAAAGAHISCALETYSGTATASAGADSEPVAENRPDIFAFEEALWRNEAQNAPRSVQFNTAAGTRATGLQKKWFEKAVNSTLRFDRSRSCEPVEMPLTITATGLGIFTKCPYRWYCSMVLGLEEAEYEADMADNLEVGNLMHYCLEKWLEKEGSIQALETPAAQQDLDRIFEQRLMEYRRRSNSPYLPRIDRMALSVPDELKKMPFAENAGLFSRMKVLPTEYRFEVPGNGYVLKGRMDCVLEDEDGSLAVIDFKKSGVDTSSPQILLYALALKHGMGRLPLYGAFYSVEKPKFHLGWKSAEELETKLEELNAAIENMVNVARGGRPEPDPSDRNCRNCVYRGMCRTRYVIK